MFSFKTQKIQFHSRNQSSARVSGLISFNLALEFYLRESNLTTEDTMFQQSRGKKARDRAKAREHVHVHPRREITETWVSLVL